MALRSLPLLLVTFAAVLGVPSRGKAQVPVTPCCDSRIRISSVPIQIPKPGSYLVTANLENKTPGANGIEVLCDDVTIDLNGWTLDGNGKGLNGIVALASVRNLVVINGTVRGWNGYGVDLFGTGPLAGENGRVEYVQIDDNADVAGTAGLRTGTGQRIAHCTFDGNGQYALEVHSACQVSDCTITFTGDSVGQPGVGILVSGGRNSVRNCLLMRNLGIGIYDREGLNDIRENYLVENLVGIQVDKNHTRVDGNHCSSNQTGMILAASITHACVVRNEVGGSITGVDYSLPAISGIGPITDASTTSPWANLRY